MKITVCTGWSPEGWKVYGEKFLLSFDKFWPRSVSLVVWGEEYPPTYHGVQSRRVFHFGKLSSIPMWDSFEAAHRASDRARGREVQPNWKDAEKQRGYNWRFDAFKWGRQAFIPWVCDMADNTADFLVWLDGDVITHAPVTEEMITGLLPPLRDFAYLGRGEKHPDIAFQLYRRGGAATDFLNAWMELYASGSVFALKEWHSAWTWKWVLDNHGFEDLGHDLTPGGHGHVWFQSPLRQWGDHLKGDRKYAGKSPERR